MRGCRATISLHFTRASAGARPSIDRASSRAERAARAEAVVVDRGRGGIGKTELVRANAEQAPFRFLWGMCDPLSTPCPLGPLRDVAAATRPPVTASLATRPPSTRSSRPCWTALRPRPRVLVIEDLHWADEATPDLVRFLGRRIGALPLLMIVSYRDTSLPPPVMSPVLGDLVSPHGRAPPARRRRTPLDGHLLDPADVHRPAPRATPSSSARSSTSPIAPLPESVRDAVITRTAGPPPDERRGVELLACARV